MRSIINGQWGPRRTGDWSTQILDDVNLLICILNTFFVPIQSMFYIFFQINLLHLPRGQEGNSDPVIGRARKLNLLILLLSFLCLLVPVSFILVCFLVLLFSRTRIPSLGKQLRSFLLFCCQFFCSQSRWKNFRLFAVGIPPAVPIPLSTKRCRGSARLAAWAGGPPSRGLHSPLVRLCSLALSACQVGGDAGTSART